MNLEGRKFHFARDEEDGRIYAEYEIETEVANREGWLLPPKKGERKLESFSLLFVPNSKLEVVYETTGELEDGHPKITITSIELVKQYDYVSRF